MMVDFFRRKMKAFIWLIVAVFVLSIFFMAAGSLFYSNQQSDQAQERAANAEKARAAEQAENELDYKATRTVATVVYKGLTEAITEGELNKGIKNAWESASRYRGSTAPLKAFKAMMGALILDNIVKERLVQMEAEAQKLDVSKDVEEVLAQNIKKAGGKEQLLAAAKMDEPALRSYFAQQLKQERIIRSITSGKPIADKAVEDYYTAHKADFKKADGKDFKPLTEVRSEIVAKLKAVLTDDDVKEYYEKHKARWMLPDKVTLRHLMLDPKAERWVKDVKNTPEEIAKYYKDHLDVFKAPKKVVLRHIFLDPASDAFKAAAQVSDEELRKAFDAKYPVEQPVQLSEIRIAGGETPETQAKAKERIEAIHAKLKTGASFSALAAESNTGELATSKGDRGTVKPSELGEPLASTVKELAVGQVSPVIEGDKAFHLLLVTGKSAVAEKDPAREKEFEAKKAELTKELEADKREEAARAQLLELRASLESSDTTTPTSAFKEAARKTSQAPSAADGGELGVVALGKNEGNPKVDELGAGGYLDENITDVITELEPGDVSRPVKSARGLHLVQLAQVLPPDHRPMKDVEKEILVKLTEQKAEKAVADAIVRIRREVAGEGPEKGGTKRSFEQIVKAESDGGDAKTGALWTDVSVGGEAEVPVEASVREETYSVNGLNPKIADAVKGLKDGELSDTITLGHTSHIYQVVSRQPKAYKPLDDAVKAEIRQALNPEVSEVELKEYFEAHKTEFEEPAQVRLQHVLTTDEEQAAEVLALALKGDDFGYLARKFSRDPATKNKDGEITSEVVIPAIREAMASAEAGKVYPKIVQSHLGFHVLRLIERKPAKPDSLESARAKILERLVPEKREKILRAWVDELVNQAIVKKTP